MHASSLVALTVALASSESAFAWFRVACTGPLVSERVDPIVDPGVTPSNHVHTVHGASGFAADATFDSLRESDCTSCKVTEDLSNYWFPKLYFHDRAADTFEEVSNGGLLIYYQNRGNEDVKNGGPGIKAFPPGLKMVSGDPMRRQNKYEEGDTSQTALDERAQFFSCLRYPAEDGYDTQGFPTTDCEAGLNARVHFPACWDGVNVDSDNHKDHVAYLDGIDNGACPDTHPVGLMKIFFEITWNVNDFGDRWEESDGWPFVFATGDPTGYSWHGDFQNGWDVEALQNAIDECDNPDDATGQGSTEACKFLTVQADDVADQCEIEPVVDEEITGVLSRLPGCNPIQEGPEDATPYNEDNCPL